MLLLKLLLMVGGSLAYFSLAVVGEGGIAPTLAHPPLVGLLAVSLIMLAVSPFAGGNISPGVREDRGNRWVLAAFGIIGLLSGYVPAWADHRALWPIDGDTVRWIGVCLYGLGGVFRLWPVFVLGNRFSGLVAIQPGHTLVTTGIYHTIRNPSYLGVILMMFGWGLAFNSWIGVLLAAMVMPPLIARIHSEESLLLSQFGEEYKAYRSHTARLIPGIY